MPMMAGIGRAVFVNDLGEDEVVRAAQFVACLHSERNNILPVQPSLVHAASEREAVHA